MQAKAAFPRTRRTTVLLILSLAGSLALLTLHTRVSTGLPPVKMRVPSASAPDPYQRPDLWRIVFSDEFTDPALNTRSWTACYWWDNQGCTNLDNREMEWYLPGNVSVSDGLLRLTAVQREHRSPTGAVYPYTSGMVSTGRSTYQLDQPTRFSFMYGFVEVRARAPHGQGLWPAIWMLPTSHQEKPEIDIMQMNGRDPGARVYFNYFDMKGYLRVSGKEVDSPNFADQWHTYAVNWTPDKISWYVDGVMIHTFSNATYIPNEPMYLLITLAVGGTFVGAPDQHTPFPSQFEIDYVRIWKQRGT
jgi:beta-glucanase (GH16 family)